MEVIVVVLQEALADSQLPDLLVFDYSFDRVLTPFKIEFETRIAQRVFELGRSVVDRGGLGSFAGSEQFAGATSRSYTHIFQLVVGV